jgi:RNA polymerase sigma factor (sigma-70 family)
VQTKTYDLMSAVPASLLDSKKSDHLVDSPGIDDQLWTSFRTGNREALNSIFEKFVRLLYAYGRHMTGDRELIEDCIQDVFVELWIKREVLAPRVDSIKSYLIKSVRRRIIHRVNASRRFVAQPIPENYCDQVEFNIESNLIEDQSRTERSEQLKSSMTTLSKRQQEAVYLKFFQNMTYDEIASVMDTNVKAVYNLIARSIVSLRKFFTTHPVAGR